MDRKWWTLVAVCLGTFMLLLDITIVNVALPSIQHSLNASFSDLQWVVDAYALTLAALLLTSGSLADLFGRRTVFVVGLVVFVAGSLLCGLAQSALWLILARAGQGVGGAIMFATSLALLAQAFQGRERGTAFGIWGSITGVAVAIGPVLGGVLTSGLSWKWIFFVNVPIGVIAVAITLTKVDESRQPGARRPDWVGFAVFTAALSALVYGLIRSNEQGWTETGVLLCFAGSFVLIVLFLMLEWTSEHAMFDLRLFRKPTFVGGSIAAFGLSASLFALLLYLVLFLQNVRGYSALGTGLRLLILSGGIMVAATLAGRATSLVPIRLLIAPGLVLVAVGLFLMSRLGGQASWTDLIPGLIVAGIGGGLINPPLASTAVGVVEPARAGMASGINSTFRQVGIATGTAALGSIFGLALTSRLRSDLSAPLAHASLPGLAAHAPALSAAINGGAVTTVINSAPPASRAKLATIISDSFVYGLDRILFIGAIIAFVAGVFSLLLIRSKDFAAGSQRHESRAEAGDLEAVPDSSSGDTAADDREPDDRELVGVGGGRSEAQTIGGDQGDAYAPARGGPGIPTAVAAAAAPAASNGSPPSATNGASTTGTDGAPDQDGPPGQGAVRPGEPAADGATTGTPPPTSGSTASATTTADGDPGVPTNGAERPAGSNLPVPFRPAGTDDGAAKAGDAGTEHELSIRLSFRIRGPRLGSRTNGKDGRRRR